MELSNKYDDDFLKRTGRKAQEERHNNIRFRLSSPSYLKATQSKSAQAIFKVTSFAKGASVKKLMEYITRTDRDEVGVPAETEDGTQVKGKDDVQSVYDDWSVDFERKKAGRKTDPRHATHIVLSAKTDNSDKSIRQVHRATSEFLKKEFGDLGYQYVFVVHKDTENPHVHAVIKNKNNILNKKLRMGKADLFALRQEYAKTLTEHGLESVATLRRDRAEVVERVAKQLETVKNRSRNVNERLMKNESASLNTYEARRYQLLNLQAVKTEIIKNTGFFSKDGRAMAKQVNAVQAAIVKNDPEKAARELKATVKYFEKDHKDIAKKLDEIMTTKPSNKQQRQERKQRASSISQYSDKYVKSIKAAIVDIRKDKNLSLEVKNSALKTLKKQQKSVEKLRSRGKLLGL